MLLATLDSCEHSSYAKLGISASVKDNVQSIPKPVYPPLFICIPNGEKLKLHEVLGRIFIIHFFGVWCIAQNQRPFRPWGIFKPHPCNNGNMVSFLEVLELALKVHVQILQASFATTLYKAVKQNEHREVKQEPMKQSSTLTHTKRHSRQHSTTNLRNLKGLTSLHRTKRPLSCCCVSQRTQ